MGAPEQGPITDSAHVVVAGASLAGLRAAEALRDEGFSGPITMIGEEPAEPYDRPPLSKQVLLGMAPAGRTRLPRLRDLGATEMRLGVAAVGLDRENRKVLVSDGRDVDYDRLVVATGVRNRPWPAADQAALEGVISVRTATDSAQLQALLGDRPNRMLVIGGGFTGCEIASVCRGLGVEVTLVELGPSPLAGALGGVLGDIAADIQRRNGVDLRVNTQVKAIEGDAGGRVRGAVLSDGAFIAADVVVVALGSMRNVEWLRGSRLAATPLGVSTDAGCRAIDMDGLVTDDVFVAGDVARFPHPLYGYQFLSLEHWENAVAMARVAAHNMVCPPMKRLPHISVPAFWSIQFGLNIKSVGVPGFGTEILFTQGSVSGRTFAAAYGRDGRIVAAVTFDHGKWIDFYRGRIETAGAFPPGPVAADGPTPDGPVDPQFPQPSQTYHPPTVVVSGHDPQEMRARIAAAEGATR